MDMNLNLTLYSVANVKDFIAITNNYGYHQELRQGRFVVDAKSILGVMSLNLSKPVTYYCETFDAGLKDKLRAYTAEA